MVYLHSRRLFSIEHKRILSSDRRWMILEDIVLTRIKQSQTKNAS